MACAVALVSPVIQALESKASGTWRWIGIRERFGGEQDEKP
jgi:hypothetical protein